MDRYFLTVDWCDKGRRGIFCNANGRAFIKVSEHTQEEMQDILGMFYLVLFPKSLPFTEEGLKQYTEWIPLAEYSNHFGVALSKEFEDAGAIDE